MLFTGHQISCTTLQHAPISQHTMLWPLSITTLRHFQYSVACGRSRGKRGEHAGQDGRAHEVSLRHVQIRRRGTQRLSEVRGRQL